MKKRTSPLKRQVRLDVWAEDDTDAVYNIEAQKEKYQKSSSQKSFLSGIN